MKCFFHENVDAVATCQVCGKALCKECASKHTPCMCDECFTSISLQNEEEKKKKKQDALIDTNIEFFWAFLKGIICSVIFTFIFRKIGDQPVPIGMSIYFFFIPFGWALITYLEQWLPGFLMSGFIFFMYLAVKMGLSIAFGIPCFLYQIVKYVIKIIHNRTAE